MPTRPSSSRARAMSPALWPPRSRCSEALGADADEHVVEHRHPREDPAELEAPADAGGRRSGAAPAPVTSLPAVGDPAGVGADHPGDAVEERRLARAVGADQGVDLAVLERDRGAVDGPDPAEGLGEPLGLQRAQRAHACAVHRVTSSGVWRVLARRVRGRLALGGTPRGSRSRLRPEPVDQRADRGQHAVRHEQHDQAEQQPEGDEVELGVAVLGLEELQRVARRRPRPTHRAEEAADPPSSDISTM